ncbi:MAG: putative drug exporter of the superfamily [Solirubrobacterales bacterium]|nr:putative drug exporter of the superfamily [Solirubrobacterales bacterium]
MACVLSPPMIERFVAAVTGPRGRSVTVSVWIALGVAGFAARTQIGEVTAAGQASYLPSHAESTQVLDVLQRDFKGGDDVPVLVVFERSGGLSAGDLDAIGRLGEGLERLGLSGATPVFAPFSGQAKQPLGDVAKIARGVGPISRDGEAALVALAIDSDERGAVLDGVKEIRAYLAAHRHPGLHSYVTGPGGVAADLEQVAEDAGQTLLIATLSLVLLLLLLVYRAPLLALMPLLVVGIAYLIAIGLTYLLIKGGLITVNTEGTFLLLVLIFGAGTDYSLLLIHRYREELDHGAEPEPALRTALAESFRPIAASAATVIAAMLVLLLADLESTHWLGPVLAIGIAVMLAAALTLLPAALSILGRRAFWPARDSSAGEKRRRWARVAGFVRRRSGAIVVTVFIGLAVLALGNLVHHGTLGFGEGETHETESSRGTEVLDEHFPPGIGSPLTAVVGLGEAEAALHGLEDLDSVKLAVPVPPSSISDEAALAIVLRGDPYSGEAAELVKGVRERLEEVAPGALVGGIPAENYDVEQTNEHDTRLIVPVVLLVVGLILMLVLRSLAAPVYLMLTVVASFAATLGLVTFAFTELLGADGIAFDLVLLAFIFLVALGVDYNIFLMTRAREEAALHGTRDGVLIALEGTGTVVTSAGLILAGTFATLTLLPLEELVQIGATVAVGVLLDTFVVRSLLIPAITYLCGERAWWPGAAR